VAATTLTDAQRELVWNLALAALDTERAFGTDADPKKVAELKALLALTDER
jgi:hypothetical protein